MNSPTLKWDIPHQISEDDQLCFLHIGKTGGSTLSKILEEMFEPEEIVPRYGSVNDLRNAETADSIENSKLIRIHSQYQDLRDISGRNKLFLTMFRDPVDRVISYYYYVKAQPTHHVYALANEYSLDEFLDLQVRHRYEWNNYQIRLLSDTLGAALVSKADVDLAKQRLQNDFVWFGLLERFDDSLDLLSYTFNWPSLLDYEKINVTEKRKKRDDLPASTIDKIISLNKLDIDFYEFASKLFDSRWSAMQTSL